MTGSPWNNISLLQPVKPVKAVMVFVIWKEVEVTWFFELLAIKHLFSCNSSIIVLGLIESEDETFRLGCGRHPNFY